MLDVCWSTSKLGITIWRFCFLVSVSCTHCNHNCGGHSVGHISSDCGWVTKIILFLQHFMVHQMLFVVAVNFYGINATDKTLGEPYHCQSFGILLVSKHCFFLSMSHVIRLSLGCARFFPCKCLHSNKCSVVAVKFHGNDNTTTKWGLFWPPIFVRSITMPTTVFPPYY